MLELGCSDGTNLISIAHGLPQSEFFGIDSASRAIAEGNQTIDDLSLNNVRLQQLDLMKFAANDVAFDYVIAHGVYSWVPIPCATVFSPSARNAFRKTALPTSATILIPAGISATWFAR